MSDVFGVSFLAEVAVNIKKGMVQKERPGELETKEFLEM